ncbi:uncharacterized protein FIESC28_00393 [Fusarium coffeatum]|uniref:Uncharacterized protein n=1 Tax=Fusarium coffeatum TaxID=231269 RepID=A0A366SCX9_9HYPO|nr:uncharacterized protein FIESC28_00393 [Fusarium coffeatum]RBR26812.1 hypothetical protein FIESC28_00393 [Fusarium coffeatum]
MAESNAVYLMTEVKARDQQLWVQAQDARRRKRYHEAEMKEQKAIMLEKDALIQSLQEQICALKGREERAWKEETEYLGWFLGIEDSHGKY